MLWHINHKVLILFSSGTMEQWCYWLKWYMIPPNLTNYVVLHSCAWPFAAFDISVAGKNVLQIKARTLFYIGYIICPKSIRISHKAFCVIITSRMIMRNNIRFFKIKIEMANKAVCRRHVSASVLFTIIMSSYDLLITMRNHASP